jgi:hypothetical protein
MYEVNTNYAYELTVYSSNFVHNTYFGMLNRYLLYLTENRQTDDMSSDDNNYY